VRLDQYLEKKRRLIDRALDEYLPAANPPDRLIEAMRYSLLGGGKRLRPILSLAACEAVGGRTDVVLPFACAIEMIHTYSLIHDDLPAIYLYDKYPGGIGLARKVYDFHTRILAASLDILAHCGCGAGCPSCVGPEVELSARAKLGARVLLEALCRTAAPAPADN
jgi:hypothetical protein